MPQHSSKTRPEATLLMLLASLGEKGFVEQLLTKGEEDPLVRNAAHQTAADIAEGKGYTQTAQILRHAEQKILSARLFEAIDADDYPKLRDCLQQGATITGSHTAPSGITIPYLCYAAIKASNRCLMALIEAKADVNATDAEGNTALHSTCRQDNVEATEELLINNADFLQKNRHNTTAKDCAVGISQKLIELRELKQEITTLRQENRVLRQKTPSSLKITQ